MKSYQLHLDDIKPIAKKMSICLGYFDGVHLGHQKIISEAVKNSKDPVGVLTFDKPVSYFLDNKKSKEVITSLNDRFRIIDRLGADYYLVLHINREFLDYSALDFIDILKKLNVSDIYVGDDYRFGKKQSGDVNLLKEHFNVHAISLLEIDNHKVSTQNIISLIKNGEVLKANKLLGHNYLINGIVIEGHHNGEKFGIRTMNIKLDSNYVIPRFGVYKVITYIDGVPHLSIANVGIHPTIDIEDMPLLEVHIPNFNEDTYGKAIYVEFIEFIRPELKFDNVDDLIAQIKSDIRKAL